MNNFVFNTFIKDYYEITMTHSDTISFKEICDDFYTWICKHHGQKECSNYPRKQIHIAIRNISECLKYRTKYGFYLRFIKRKIITELEDIISQTTEEQTVIVESQPVIIKPIIRLKIIPEVNLSQHLIKSLGAPPLRAPFGGTSVVPVAYPNLKANKNN